MWKDLTKKSCKWMSRGLGVACGLPSGTKMRGFLVFNKKELASNHGRPIVQSTRVHECRGCLSL